MCKNPCNCGIDALCSVINHNATCFCPPNYSGYPEKGCIEENKCKDAKKYVHQCPGWAKNGQCEANSFNFTHTQCAKSCDLCNGGKIGTILPTLKNLLFTVKFYNQKQFQQD